MSNITEEHVENIIESNQEESVQSDSSSTAKTVSYNSSSGEVNYGDVPKKKKLTILSMILMQGVVIIYTMAGVCSKMAGGQDFMTPGFILFYGGQIAVLGIYALLWQQIIKRIDLSVAYVNRALAILWSMIWAVLFFGEGITIQNVIGVVLVLAGTIIVNGEAKEPLKEEKTMDRGAANE